MKIVTSGSPYIDIDAYAGCIAYAELLRLMGHDAKAVTTSNLNESITAKIKDWNAEIAEAYTPSASDSFVLIDVSSPENFDEIVELSKVEEVIDHHPGYEEYWQNRIGSGSQIEFIGSACTLVFEKWKVAGLANNMSETSARLLICGILDNTLNFGASVSTERDKEAYDELLKAANLPSDWVQTYFSDCSSAIFSSFASALRDDTKILTFITFPTTIAVGQIVVWDGSSVPTDYADEIETVLSQLKPSWFVNIVSVSEGKSYFYATDLELKHWLGELLGIEFQGHLAVADRLWLRKEILKQDILVSSKTETKI